MLTTSDYWSLSLNEDFEIVVAKEKTKKEKKPKLSKLVGTFFRNALRSNLDLTALADTKAGILISINGFILTVGVTASGFVVHSDVMVYVFISIILTSLGSIILAVLAVKPRSKEKLVAPDQQEGYSSLLYYQDMADLAPSEYVGEMNEVLFSTKKSTNEMIKHLHILGSEIKKKYFWLKQAYTFFSLGLVISTSLIIYALVYVEVDAAQSSLAGGVVYKKEKFYNIFEPSGATTMPDGKILIAEDESGINALKIVEIEGDNSIVEVGDLHMPKKIKKLFKKDVEDIEAIASDENIVFAITSHSLGKDNKEKSEREKFIMFSYKDGAVEDFHTYSDLKKDLIAGFPELFRSTIFTSSGMDIEGLCFEDTNGTLLVGFKAPLIDGKAMLIGIENPKEMFVNGEKPRFSKPIMLDLHAMGIRDITYDEHKDGYWIIAGGSNDRNNNFQLWFWDKKNAKVTTIKNHPELGFAEGITLINKDTNKQSLFIIQDDGRRPNKPAGYMVIERDSL